MRLESLLFAHSCRPTVSPSTAKRKAPDQPVAKPAKVQAVAAAGEMALIASDTYSMDYPPKR